MSFLSRAYFVEMQKLAALANIELHKPKFGELPSDSAMRIVKHRNQVEEGLARIAKDSMRSPSRNLMNIFTK